MQGPNVPWCVGSVFFPPQLLTADLGPLIFNPVGNPHRLLSIRQWLQQIETTLSTSKQTERFLKRTATPFVPRDLLEDHLVSSSSKNQKTHLNGNMLQGLKCSDGSVIVFFICGEGTDHIAGTIFHGGSTGKWFSMRTSISSQCLDDSEQPDWSVSPSLQHPIRQLSAVWADSLGKGSTSLVVVAARTDYYVYFCTISIEEDRVKFISRTKYEFQVPTAHVTWSSHANGRAAVILKSGTLCLFEVKDSSSNNSTGAFEPIPTATIICPKRSPLRKLSMQTTGVTQNQDEDHGQNELNSAIDLLRDVAVQATENIPEVENEWWCCEFGWLPHTLLVANSLEVFLVDLMEHDCLFGSYRKTEVEAKSSMGGFDLMADVGSSESSRFCLSKSEKENIVAFGRDVSDGMYEFSVATEHHVILYDIRQPQTPILQWEHAMNEDPPSLLIMCPLSALQSCHGKENWKDTRNGRVILAVSFRSGDIRVFCYGPDVSIMESPMHNSPQKQKFQGDEWGKGTYAWDIPSRLSAPQAKVEDWRYILGSSQGSYGHGLYVPKSYNGEQHIAGIVLLSERPPKCSSDERKKRFTILQLTGHGELLAQDYTAAHEFLDPTIADLSIMDDKLDGDDSESVQVPRLRELKFEVLPAFLMYVRTGSVLNSERSRNSEKESTVTDDTECMLFPGQEQSRGRDTSEWTSQDPADLNLILEKTINTQDLETLLLKVLMREIHVPLSMFEVAWKVLGIGLPERPSRGDWGIPSDLNAHWHRGYNFPLVSPLLSYTALSPKSSDARGEVEPSEGTLSEGLARKRRFQETIPLPLLLEVHVICKSNKRPSPGKISKRGVLGEGEHLPDTEDFVGTKSQPNGLTFCGGHRLLLEGSQYVDGLIEQFISKQNRRGISLSEPTQMWQENLSSDGLLDLQLLLYTVPEKGLFTTNSGKLESNSQESLAPAGRATGRTGMSKSTEAALRRDLKAKSKTSVEVLYSNFVGQKEILEDQESRPAKRCLEIDPRLCPLNLWGTDPDAADEELDPEELVALNDMQANFLQWQKSFSPYKTIH